LYKKLIPSNPGRKKQDKKSMRLTQSKKRKLTLNITSLIDVLFILIIFFAVSSTFLEQPGIELDLPEAESSEGLKTHKIIIYLDKDKNIYLNENIVSLSHLEKEIKELTDSQKEKSVVLKADEKVPHGLVISIMDLLRKQGIYKIIISTVKST
jgi:biopolymer transport protein ExbD